MGNCKTNAGTPVYTKPLHLLLCFVFVLVTTVNLRNIAPCEPNVVVEFWGSLCSLHDGRLGGSELGYPSVVLSHLSRHLKLIKPKKNKIQPASKVIIIGSNSVDILVNMNMRIFKSVYIYIYMGRAK